ncbi:MAG: hypothetical protein LC687_00750 [Actinobacteria bacterium]|nr:hypothetical protein [Actinomycetota bacterium]
MKGYKIDKCMDELAEGRDVSLSMGYRDVNISYQPSNKWFRVASDGYKSRVRVIDTSEEMRKVLGNYISRGFRPIIDYVDAIDR